MTGSDATAATGVDIVCASGKRPRRLPGAAAIENIIDRLRPDLEDEHGMRALQTQSERLRVLLGAHRQHIQRGRELLVAAPSPFSILTDAHHLRKIIDQLDDTEGTSVALVCKAFNHAFVRGQRDRSREFIRLGREGGVEMLISYFSCKGGMDNAGELLASPSRLRWAQSLGYEYSDQTAARLAAAGSVDALQLVVADGCDWGEHLAIWSASAGQLEALRWAAERGCPCNLREVCEWAATGTISFKIALNHHTGNVADVVATVHERALAVVQWAMADGARCADISAETTAGEDCGEILERAVLAGNVVLIRWLAQHGGLVNFDPDQIWKVVWDAPVCTIEPTMRCLLDLDIGRLDAGWSECHAAGCASCVGPSAEQLRAFLIRQSRGMLDEFEGVEMNSRMRGNLPLLRRLRQEGWPFD
jgi:hypothetical protein